MTDLESGADPFQITYVCACRMCSKTPEVIRDDEHHIEHPKSSLTYACEDEGLIGKTDLTVKWEYKEVVKQQSSHDQLNWPDFALLMPCSSSMNQPLRQQLTTIKKCVDLSGNSVGLFDFSCSHRKDSKECSPLYPVLFASPRLNRSSFFQSGMGKELVTACIFCLLCATQSHCSGAHHEESSSSGPLSTPAYNDSSGLAASSPTSNLAWNHDHTHSSRDTRSLSKGDDFILQVFNKFGSGDTMSKDNFVHFINSVCEDYYKSNNSEPKSDHGTGELSEPSLCKSAESYLKSNKEHTHAHNHDHDHDHDHDHNSNQAPNNLSDVWVYASLSVLMISLCGLLAVTVIPLMHKGIYQFMLQFLVALAVGTLTGDALLHLLPHAMMSAHVHKEGAESSSNHDDQHSVNMWRGLVAVLALAFFYFTEKCLSAIAEWRKKSNRKHKQNNMRVRVMRDERGANPECVSDRRVGEKLCKHKYSSYPYCYGEITKADGYSNHVPTNAEINSITNSKDENGTTKPVINNIREVDKNDDVAEKQLLEAFEATPEPYTTVILREHDVNHHGHAHTHGHVHSAPGSLSSVAWMVVMGDGLHNFTDGLAIGAAFAANIGGGFSTAIAVFCHELPHELGDFAVLIKAGMTAKQAVFYNVLSSALCFLGMCIGVILGHNESTTLWVFSAAAGMFLYIALVDMIPELSSSHSKESGSLCQSLLQVLGLLTGIGIMLLIALYEHDLKDTFKGQF